MSDPQGGPVGAVMVELHVGFLTDSAWEGHLPPHGSPHHGLLSGSC